MIKSINLISNRKQIIKNNKIQNSSKENRRNYGIDLLRILSMINIIILHINACGGQLKLNTENPKYKPIWRLETICYWNCRI